MDDMPPYVFSPKLTIPEGPEYGKNISSFEVISTPRGTTTAILN